MPVHFEDFEDFHLGNSPLAEVICQVRFPTILGISKEDPVDFQENVREYFPELEIEQTVLISPLGHESVQSELKPRIFRFKDSEDNYSVTLAPDFFALVSKSYTTWIDFREKLQYVTEAIQSIYRIPYANRVGLRFINVFTIENTGTSDFEELTDIFCDSLVTLLRIPEIESPYVLNQEIRTRVNDDGDFTLRFGLREETTNELVLDFDRYCTEKTSLEDLRSCCDRYHKSIYNAFRWAIKTDRIDIFS
jgi:uncharacterized protein (TIGR04255 family)